MKKNDIKIYFRLFVLLSHDDMDKWLEAQKQEFYERYPEFRAS